MAGPPTTRVGAGSLLLQWAATPFESRACIQLAWAPTCPFPKSETGPCGRSSPPTARRALCDRRPPTTLTIAPACTSKLLLGLASPLLAKLRMFRNQYDNDVTVWSPQGRLHQVEYAMEAVKQGSATVGVKSATHAVLVALKRASSELAAHQKKIMPIDKHIAVSISGLTADARVLSKFMRTECLNEHFSHNQALSLSKLMQRVGAKMQIATQRYDKRPYGVGLLVAGFDEDGPHIYQTCPSANYYDCKAMAVGARSQSARTYLERHLEEFLSVTRDELIRHALRALRDTLPNDVELTNKNCSIAVVGEGEELSIYDDDDVNPYLEGLDQEERRGGAGTSREAQPAEAPADGDASADQPPPPPSDEQPQADSMETD